MNIKAFCVDALTSALELGIGAPADVIRHVTPDVLATHLPRPLWARLFTACLVAPRVDAQLIVETLGIPNLCEHIPTSIIWACIAEIGARSLGKVPDISVAPAPLPKATAVTAPPSTRTTAERAAVLAPPPDERPPAPTPAPAPPPIAVGPSIPAPAPVHESLADVISEIEAQDANEPRIANLRPRSPTAQRFRQSNTAVGRLGTAARRPQAAAVPTPATSPSGSSATSTSLGSRPRRDPTEISDPEPDLETQVGLGDGNGNGNGSGNGEEWRNTPSSRDIVVDDSQLVDWQATTDGSGSTGALTADDDFSDLTRKR